MIESGIGKTLSRMNKLMSGILSLVFWYRIFSPNKREISRPEHSRPDHFPSCLIPAHSRLVITRPVSVKDSGNDFRFPDIAAYTGRFHFFGRISSVVSFWVDI